VRVAWVGVNTALQRLRTTEQLVKHATEAFNLAEARYKVGSSSVIELSEAQLSQTSAEITQVNARYDTLIENAVLDYQIGSIR
jgi:outer membrane protein